MNKYLKQKLLLAILIGIIITSCSKESPDQGHKLTSRKFQGIPSLAISPEGQLWATWYAGITPDEDQNNYVVVATSGDDGKTWTEKLIIDPDDEGPVRAFDPELWIDPDGMLWSIWAQTIGHDGTISGVWARTNNNPDKGDSGWSEPRRITDGIMMCKPIVLSSGEWIFPVSTWEDTDNSARIIISTDKGKSFSLRGACHIPKDVRTFDEHMIIERKDKSLWMLVRTSYGIGESVSNDRGKTWSPLVPSPIQHPSARFFIRRLHSGNLLLVKHGPISERIGRSHLTAYLSEDDGFTWSGGLLLDERNGVSYPDGQQSQDGTIHIIYDYSRTSAREILMATFTESDITAGDTASASVSLRMIISKFSELGFDSKKVFKHEAIVKINSRQKENEIRFTTDGTEPNESSLLYTKPFKVTETTRIKIKEFSPDGIKRPVYEANYIKQKPIKPESVVINSSGLNFEYFEFKEPIDSLVDIQKYEPTKKGEIETLVFPYETEELPDYFGLRFSGYINVPKEDVYMFSVLSNDGSRLFISDNLVVDNDGLHGAFEKEGEIALQAGWHKISLSYFQAGGGKDLKVFWKSIGFEKREIAGNVLSR